MRMMRLLSRPRVPGRGNGLRPWREAGAGRTAGAYSLTWGQGRCSGPLVVEIAAHN